MHQSEHDNYALANKQLNIVLMFDTSQVVLMLRSYIDVSARGTKGFGIANRIWFIVFESSS